MVNLKFLYNVDPSYTRIEMKLKILIFFSSDKLVYNWYRYTMLKLDDFSMKMGYTNINIL